MIVSDIETGTLDLDYLKTVSDPFIPPPHPGEFDPASVKYGRMKDPMKRAAKLTESRQAHETAVANYEANTKAAESEYWESMQANAALSSLTGQILAIGYLSTDADKIVLDIGEEVYMIRRFWDKCKQCKIQNRLIVGHNFLGFDLPFIVGRSWIRGIPVPPIFDARGYPDSSLFADTMKTWACGRHGVHVSLDKLARAMDIGRKPPGIDGSQFAALLKSDPPLAREYLENDLRMTAAVARRMGMK